MASTFDTCRVQPECSTPHVTSFVGVSENNRTSTSGTKEECRKIMIDLNQEVSRYCFVAVALGTTLDSDYLRLQLRQSRLKAWDYAKSVKKKLIPMIRKKRFKLECCSDLEQMYRVFCSTLEYLEGIIFNSMLVLMKFPLYSGCILIETGQSEIPLPRKSTVDVKGLNDLSQDERQRHAVDEIANLQSEINDLQEMIYEMNCSIAIQPWEVESDRLAVDGIDKDGSSGDSSIVEFGASSGNEDQRKLRCASIVVLVVICVLIGGIVGILMGVLDY